MIIQRGPVNAYHPATRTVTFTPGASLYTRCHEVAHATQHEGRSGLFLLWLAVFWIPFVRRFAVYLIERDARDRARRIMERMGRWDDEAETEANEKLSAYRKTLWTL
jgi:hypothetical protein